MSTINLTVIDHEIIADNASLVLAQDSNNFDTCNFTFDNNWYGYSKEAIFYQNLKNVIKVPLIDNSCKIPRDALLYNKTLYIGVRGKNDDSNIATTKMVSFWVDSGAIDGSTYKSTEVTQTELEQLLSSIDKKVDKSWGSENSGKFLSIGADGNVQLSNAPSGGTIDDAQIQAAVGNYLQDNPIQSGATTEQANQIQKNTNDISFLDSHKVNLPKDAEGNAINGTNGQILQTNGDGTTQWIDKPSGSGSGITQETDPTVPAWAKQPQKPSYTATEVGAEPSGTVSTHNTAVNAHNDIRSLIDVLTTRLNTLADSDDTTLDQLSEIVSYIKSNRSLIDSITTSKVNVSDIVDNLTSSDAKKPLSAKQGAALKALVDAITIPEKLPNPNALSITVNGITKTYDGSKVVTIDIPSGSTDNSGDTNHYYVTPEQYGAVGDGTTNDTEAFRQAIETEKPIICMPGKDYYFANEIVTDKTRINIDGNYSHFTAFRLKINVNDDETNWKTTYPHPDSVIQNIYFMNKNNQDYCIKTGIPIKFVNIDIYYYDLWLKNYGDYMDYMVFDNVAINSRPSNNNPCIELTYLGDNHVFRECRFGGYDTNINYVQVSGCKAVNFIDCIINGNVTVYQSVINFNGCHFENDGKIIIGDANLNSVVNFNGCFFFDQYTVTVGKNVFYNGCGFLVNYRAYGGQNDYMSLNTKDCIIFCSTELANTNCNVVIDELRKSEYPNVVYSGNKIVFTPVVLTNAAKSWGIDVGTYTYKFFQSCNPYSIDYGDPSYSTGEESVDVSSDTSCVQFRSNYETYTDMFIHAYRTNPSGVIQNAVIQVTSNYIYDYGESLNGILWKEVDSVPEPKSTTAVYRNGVYYSGKNYTNARNCMCINTSDGSISYISNDGTVHQNSYVDASEVTY